MISAVALLMQVEMTHWEISLYNKETPTSCGLQQRIHLQYPYIGITSRVIAENKQSSLEGSEVPSA